MQKKSLITRALSCIVILFVLFISIFCWKKYTEYKLSLNKKVKIIGVGASYEADKSKPSEYGYLYDKQFLRTRYIDQFAKACKKKNVVFVMVPVNESQIDKIANFVDGMIFTGGDDMNAKFFGQKQHPSAMDDIEPENRTKFDIKLIKKLMKKKKPIMGICLGMQELNVAFGGDIIQDIPSMIPSSDVNHRGIDAVKHAHKVNIVKNSLLYKIINKNSINVNSGHHQAVGKIAKKFVATAVAPDGVVEAIECKNCDNFVLGLQWHTEFLLDKNDVKIIQAFCDAVADSN